MSAEVKVLSASTRTNLEALKHHMKKLGFKYYEEKDGWIKFSTRLYDDVIDGGQSLDSANHISVMTNHKDLFCMIDDLETMDKLPEAKQAIMDFYKAEGISDED